MEVSIILHGDNDSNSRIGNKLASIIYARAILEKIEEGKIYGFSLPELGINFENFSVEKEKGRSLHIREHYMSPQSVSDLVKYGDYSNVHILTNGLQLPFFLDQLDHWRSHFDSLNLNKAIIINDDEILLNIRANEIVSRFKHKDYAPLPIEFYEWVVKSTGLKPVFVGQFEPSVYLDMLKEKFPNSPMHHLDPLEAFECLLNAKNKVLSISTFSWYAAWLGRKDSKIIMPLSGYMNPLQRKDINLVPSSDNRYHFVWMQPLKRSVFRGLKSHLNYINEKSGHYEFHPKFK